MDSCRIPSSNAIGFCLLPCELVEKILICLALPEIIRFRLVSKYWGEILRNKDFINHCNSQWKPATWLFVYKKRRRCDSVLDGFTDRSDRWFRFSISDLLKPAVFPGEDLFFLAASGNFFLFASNTLQSVITVNLATNTVKKIPPSPLGRRGTCSWRRSGMKLVPYPDGTGNFRFLFAELVENLPTVFEYDSMTETWRSTVVEEEATGLPCGSDCIFLNLINRARESVVIAIGGGRDAPVILRPRHGEVGGVTVGISWGNGIDRLRVYGDGYMMVVKSDELAGFRVFSGIEIWKISLDSRRWEFMSGIGAGAVGRSGKRCGAMTGCLEGGGGRVRAVLMSNFEGAWDVIWVTYDVEVGDWTWVPLPECKMTGLNVAGIAFSSGLGLPVDS